MKQNHLSNLLGELKLRKAVLDEDLEDVSRLVEAMDGQESDDESPMVASIKDDIPALKKELEGIWQVIKKCEELLEQNDLEGIDTDTTKAEAGLV